MKGGGSNTQTTSASPWSGQSPYLQDVFSQAQNLYRQGGPDYYPRNTVTPMSGTTQDALTRMQQTAQAGGPADASIANYMTSTLDGSQIGLDPNAANAAMGGTAQGMQQLGQFSQNPYNATTAPGGDAYGDLLQRMSAPAGFGETQARVGAVAGSPSGATPSAAGQQLTDTASGSFLGSNPYLDATYNNAAERMTDSFNRGVMPGINATFGGAGRTGSGIHAETIGQAAGALGDDLRGLASDVYMPAYENERGRMLSAAGTAGNLDLGAANLASNMYLGERGQGLDAAGMGLNTIEGGLDRQFDASMALPQLGLSGTNAMTNMYGAQQGAQQGAASLAPMMRDMQYGDIMRELGVGETMENYDQQQVQANMDRWNYNVNNPYQNLARYSNMINQMPGGYGTTTQETPRGSPLAGALGGAMTGAQLGSVVPGLGTGIGAGIGGILGLLQ